MSLQNILAPNDLDLYCRSISMAGSQPTIFSSLSVSLPIKYNNVIVGNNLDLVFNKISVPGGKAIVFVYVPSMSPVDVSSVPASKFYIDISSLTDYSIDPLANNGFIVEVVNNSASSYGNIFVDPTTQKIWITYQHLTSFSASGTAGLAQPILLTYQHTDA